MERDRSCWRIRTSTLTLLVVVAVLAAALVVEHTKRLAAERNAAGEAMRAAVRAREDLAVAEHAGNARTGGGAAPQGTRRREGLGAEGGLRVGADGDGVVSLDELVRRRRDGQTLVAIAAATGLRPSAVYRRLRLAGLTRRPRPSTGPPERLADDSKRLLGLDGPMSEIQRVTLEAARDWRPGARRSPATRSPTSWDGTGRGRSIRRSCAPCACCDPWGGGRTIDSTRRYDREVTQWGGSRARPG